MIYPEITSYIGLGSKKLNFALMKKEKPCNDIIDHEMHLNAELDSLGTHAFNETFAHDGMTNVPFEILSIWYKKRIGKIVMFPNFLSTSSYRWPNRKVTYNIKPATNTRGKELAEAIGVKGEREILYKSKTKFRIDMVGNEIELSEYNGEHVDFVLKDCFYMDDKEVSKLVIANRNLQKNFKLGIME